MRQYKSGGKPLLVYKEKQFAECKRLIDKHINSWPLSDQDNVFYVLSGYAYSTYKAIKAGKTKKDENTGEKVVNSND